MVQLEKCNILLEEQENATMLSKKEVEKADEIGVEMQLENQCFTTKTFEESNSVEFMTEGVVGVEEAVQSKSSDELEDDFQNDGLTYKSAHGDEVARVEHSTFNSNDVLQGENDFQLIEEDTNDTIGVADATNQFLETHLIETERVSQDFENEMLEEYSSRADKLKDENSIQLGSVSVLSCLEPDDSPKKKKKEKVEDDEDEEDDNTESEDNQEDC